MLEHMLNTCDNMDTKDTWVIEYQGKSIQQLVDSINITLVRQLNSKTRLSCRNVLVANFETMTKTAHWLKHKLYVDLPKDLTAEMLSGGILKYAEVPNGEEIQGVDKEKLALTMTDKNKITESFIDECAKLRRYSHWDGDRFMIDYKLLLKYLYCFFGKLTSEQHIKMFEYEHHTEELPCSLHAEGCRCGSRCRRNPIRARLRRR